MCLGRGCVVKVREEGGGRWKVEEGVHMHMHPLSYPAPHILNPFLHLPILICHHSSLIIPLFSSEALAPAPLFPPPSSPQETLDPATQVHGDTKEGMCGWGGRGGKRGERGGSWVRVGAAGG